jgi:hypothetical protein
MELNEIMYGEGDFSEIPKSHEMQNENRWCDRNGAMELCQKVLLLTTLTSIVGDRIRGAEKGFKAVVEGVRFYRRVQR